MSSPTPAGIMKAVDDITSYLTRRFDRLESELGDIRGDIAAVSARLDERRAWLQPTDQRFIAITAPYQPRGTA